MRVDLGLCWVLVAGLCGVYGKAEGAVVPYRELSAFLADSGPLIFESFEDSPLLPYERHGPIALSGFTVVTENLFCITTTALSSGQHPSDGVKFLAYNSFGPVPVRELTIRFDQPIVALSFDVIDFGDLPLYLGQTLTMTTSAGDSILMSKTVGDYDPPDGNQFFFGILSDIPLSEISLYTTNQDTIALDAFRYRFVPEPSIFAVTIIGTAVLIGFARFVRRARGLNASAGGET
jgi:hypothetical protein